MPHSSRPDDDDAEATQTDEHALEGGHKRHQAHNQPLGRMDPAKPLQKPVPSAPLHKPRPPMDLMK